MQEDLISKVIKNAREALGKESSKSEEKEE